MIFVSENISKYISLYIYETKKKINTYIYKYKTPNQNYCKYTIIINHHLFFQFKKIQKMHTCLYTIDTNYKYK